MQINHTGSSAGRTARSFVVLASLLLAASACGSSASSDGAVPLLPVGPDAMATLATSPLGPQRCAEAPGSFVAHDLAHVTDGPGDTASTFDGTGSGIAAGDLDDDGDLDLVAANLSGFSTLLRNDGDLVFTPLPLVEGRFRHVAIIDVEGDGDRDVVLSTGIGVPVFLERGGLDGNGDPAFERGVLPGVRAITYSMAWGDLGGDGDLDLVAGSYNAEITQIRNSPMLGSDTGVIVYEREADAYLDTRIAAEAQALAVRLVDMNGDYRTDIVVGNDLATPDGLWFDNDGGWLRSEELPTTSFSTMSLDAGDIDNDGDLDLFSTDMRPMSNDAETRERYRFVTQDMEAMPIPDDVQTPENVLLTAGDNGFVSVGPEAGVNATGWSWSGIFGDLDADGFLDLHVVNGMRSDLLFDFLPDARLVEPNQAFRNTGDGSMVAAPEWNLADDAGGRGMVMGDMDGDGDLDIVINNLDEPTRLYENQICEGRHLIVDLEWPGSANRDGIGAIVRVETADGIQTRTIDASRGYLSGGPLQAHFGVRDAGLDGGESVTVRVLWPDGQRSDAQSVSMDQYVTFTRTSPPS